MLKPSTKGQMEKFDKMARLDNKYGDIECVCCEERAITTAAHIPVCQRHWEAYESEAKKYLPENERVFWSTLQAYDNLFLHKKRVEEGDSPLIIS